MTRSVSIVGAVRVGRTLGKLLRARGWHIESVAARTLRHARAAVRAIGAGKACAGICERVCDAQVVLVATPDDALAGVSLALARLGKAACRGKIVLHTSGALDRRVLAPLARAGACTGSIHPLQTFSGRGVPQLRGATFAIEGDARARTVAREIARELGGVPVAIAARSKAAYHAAAVLAAGHALGLVDSAVEILTSVGLSRKRAIAALLPLTRQTLENFERVGARAAWTGPVARQDYETVAKHVRALRRYPRELQQAYAALALLSARLLSENPAKAEQHLQRVLLETRPAKAKRGKV